MKRLIATTALALIVAAPVYAAGTNTETKTDTMTPAASAQNSESTLERKTDAAGNAVGDAADKTGAAMSAAGSRMEARFNDMTTEEGWVDVNAETVTAEQLEGVDVYDTNNDDIGDVADLVLEEDGKTVKGAIVDVGGFLGMGEHRVMIPMDELKIMSQADDSDDFRVYIGATREELEAMPEYEI